MNKAFDAAAAPVLFREVNFGGKGVASLLASANSAHLRHVRKLTVEAQQWFSAHDDTVKYMLLSKMPLLESLKYVVKIHPYSQHEEIS